MINGYDVSKHQGAVQHSAFVRAGHEFVFVKATEGVGYRDRRFRENTIEAHRQGLLVGAYHFARVSAKQRPGETKGRALIRDAQAEADWHVSQLEIRFDLRIPFDLPSVLDIEWDKRVAPDIGARDLVEWCQVWLDRVHRKTGKRPIVYTGPSFWRYKLGKSLALAEYPLWQADYRKTRRTIPGWEPAFWQFTGSGQRPDVPTKRVDLNRFLGSRTALITLGLRSDVSLGTPDPGVQPTVWERAVSRALQKLIVSPRIS